MLEKPRVEFVPIHQLTRDLQLQMRANVAADSDNLERVRQIIRAGGRLPPCEVVSDGRANWLTDGWMRTAAMEMEDRGQIECVIYSGNFLDAQMRALKANAANGCGRTDADRRKAINALLDSNELLSRLRATYGSISLKAIAEACGVSDSTVDRVLASRGQRLKSGEILNDRKPEQYLELQKASAGNNGSRETIAADYGDDPDDDDDTPIFVEEPPDEPPAERARREAVSNVHKLRIAFAGSIDRYLESLLAGPLGNRLRRSAEKEGYPIPDDVADWLPLRALRRTFAGVKI